MRNVAPMAAAITLQRAQMCTNERWLCEEREMGVRAFISCNLVSKPCSFTSCASTLVGPLILIYLSDLSLLKELGPPFFLILVGHVISK